MPLFKTKVHIESKPDTSQPIPLSILNSRLKGSNVIFFWIIIVCIVLLKLMSLEQVVYGIWESVLCVDVGYVSVIVVFSVLMLDMFPLL